MSAPHAAWAPQADGLQTIVQLLTEYRQPGADQAQIYASLQQCSAVPDFNNYLAYLLSQAVDKPLEVRQSAGLLLKNNLRSWAGLNPLVQAYVKACLLTCLGIPERYVRITVGTAVSVVVAAGGGLAAWPELVVAVVQALDGSDLDAADGALDALFKVCEEVPEQLDSVVPGLTARPADLLLPRLLSLFASPHVKLRKRAMGCVNLLVGFMPAALVKELDRYVQSLVALAMDEDPDVRKLVCQGLVALMQNVPERLQPHLRQVVQYMLERNQERDSEVALESCEFWCAFCEAELTPEYFAVLREFIPQLIPVLLTNMAYAEDDEDVLAAEEEELRGDRPDRDQDIKPFAQHARLMGGAAADGEEGEEDDGADADDAVSAWTLRKSSASSLDVLSNVFPDELLPVMLPIVQVRLAERDWKLRESAILALGAVAEGCSAGLDQLAPQIIQGLLPMLQDARPLVRSITCWTLGRYSKWLLPRGDQPLLQAPLQALVNGLLQRVLDKSKPVQAAACCAVATLAEEAGSALAPLLEPILRQLVAAVGMYQRKNMRHVYDALATLASSVDTALTEPRLVALCMPPLLTKWQALASDDREQLPLLECLTTLIPSTGVAFQPYAAPVFLRCLTMAQPQVQLKQAPTGSGSEYEPELVVGALDVVSGMVEGLDTSMESLAEQSQLRELVLLACADESPDVRQSGLALMGDLARACPSHLMPTLQRCFEACCATLQHEQLLQPGAGRQPCFLRAGTNACWAIGELALRAPAEDMARCVLPLLQCVATMLTLRVGAGGKGMLENAGITLGRLALRCPEAMAPHLQSFVAPWCIALRRVRDGAEKEQAFTGLCTLVQQNPMSALPAFVAMANAFASWRTLKNEALHRQMSEIMRGYQAHLPADAWSQAWDSLEPAVQVKLRTWYMS